MDERLIPPVLDGLDEIRELVRQAAIARINTELKAAGHSRNLSPGASVVMAEGYGSTPGAALRYPPGPVRSAHPHPPHEPQSA